MTANPVSYSVPCRWKQASYNTANLKGRMLMRGIGILLLIVGLLALLVGGGALGVALFIVGGIFTAMGRRKISQVPAGVEVAPASETRRGPFFAETIKAQAVACPFCTPYIDPLQ